MISDLLKGEKGVRHDSVSNDVFFFSVELLHGTEHLPFPDRLLLLQGEGFLLIEGAFLKKIEVC